MTSGAPENCPAVFCIGLNLTRGCARTHRYVNPNRLANGPCLPVTGAEAAAERGYKYLAITDHSKGLKIAGGIDEQQLRKQGEEIEVVNASFRSNKMPFRLLRSIELNLSPEGRGDMDEYALQSLDLVLGCFHSALRRK